MTAMLIGDEIVILSAEGQQPKKKKEKTLQQREKQRQKQQEKDERNHELSQFPKFTVEKPYQVIFINYMTAYFVLIRLIERAEQTLIFAMDTERDIGSGHAALIQIQFVSFDNNKDAEKQVKSIIVIFEMCHLPSSISPIYSRIQQLLQTIFHPSKTILTWGDGEQELMLFIRYPIVRSLPLDSLNHKNVQKQFKNWYNSTYKHNSNCIMSFYNNITDDPTCSCSHRPYKCSGDTWSLQLAISIILKQFLDKSITKNYWGQGLDRRLYENWQMDTINYNVTSCLTAEEEKSRLKLVQYAVDDCLALTELAFIIRNYLF